MPPAPPVPSKSVALRERGPLMSCARAARPLSATLPPAASSPLFSRLTWLATAACQEHTPALCQNAWSRHFKAVVHMQDTMLELDLFIAVATVATTEHNVVQRLMIAG